MDNIKRYSVYFLIDPRDNLIFYVGMGKENRPYQHKRSALRFRKRKFICNKHKIYKILSILDAGLDYIVHYEAKNLTQLEAYELEKSMISKIGIENLTNISLGGSGGDNLSNNPNKKEIKNKISETMKKYYKDNPELLKALSERMTGDKNPMYKKTDHTYGLMQNAQKCRGKTFEEIYRKDFAKIIKQKMSNSQKGIKKPGTSKAITERNLINNCMKNYDTRQKVSIANKGRVPSEETKRKMSLSHKGKKRSECYKQSVSGKNNGRYVDVSEENILKIVYMYITQRMNMKDIGKLMLLSDNIIKRVLLDKNIAIRNNKNHK